jgi:hypothetical protein
MPKLNEAGRFTLIRDEKGRLLWQGRAGDDEEVALLEEISLRPDHWPVGTVVVAYEPDHEALSLEEQKRVYGVGIEVEKEE